VADGTDRLAERRCVGVVTCLTVFLYSLVAASGARHFSGFHPIAPMLLISLIMAGIALGHLSSRATLQVNSPQAHPTEAEMIYELIQNTTQLDLHRKPGPQLASLIHAIFAVEAVAIFDADLNEVYRAGEWFEDLEDLVRNVYFFETSDHDPATGLSRRVLRVGNLPIGALLLRGDISELTSNAIAAVTAITFDRYHSLANENRTESARQVERLRTTVLDSLAHAYKTPLTAIRAASTGLGEMGNLTPAQSGMVALIDEQSELLNRLTDRLLKTARLEAKDLVLFTETIAIAPLIEDVVAGVREQLGTISVKIALERENLSICCDRNLILALLTQYMENAAKYADSETTVTISASEQRNNIVFSVHNLGPSIPAQECERVFDRYFRSSAHANRAPGTGIGLSVAKRAAEAHGGHVWVTSDAIRGTTFFASLPAAAQGGSC
jgi:two-component system sensor histidine kinase KdpD